MKMTMHQWRNASVEATGVYQCNKGTCQTHIYHV